MDILENGKIIKNKEKDATFTPMVKNMMVNGSEIKNLVMELISTKMVMFTLVDGEMIVEQEKEKLFISTKHST